MSSENSVYFTKDKLDTYLKEVAFDLPNWWLNADFMNTGSQVTAIFQQKMAASFHYLHVPGCGSATQIIPASRNWR